MAMRVTGRPSPASGWLSGLTLGAVGGFAVLELGVLGVGVVAAALGLIAWKGPRLLAAGGLVTGIGVVWTVLFLRVQLTCGPGAPLPESGCVSEDLTAWIVGSGALLLGGLAASTAALRSNRR